jgi:hypothetical protein
MDDFSKGIAMRRMMPALILLATLVAPAAAQTEMPAVSSQSISVPMAGSPCSGGGSCGLVPMTGCGNGTGSSLAAYMNCFPNHPDLWASYPAERAARLAHCYKHFNGCDCLDPKRHLHAEPSVICGSKGCDAPSCDGTQTLVNAPAAKAPVVNRYKERKIESFSKLYGTPSDATGASGASMASFRILKPAFPSAHASLPISRPIAKPASSDVRVTPIR